MKKEVDGRIKRGKKYRFENLFPQVQIPEVSLSLKGGW